MHQCCPAGVRPSISKPSLFQEVLAPRGGRWGQECHSTLTPALTCLEERLPEGAERRPSSHQAERPRQEPKLPTPRSWTSSLQNRTSQSLVSLGSVMSKLPSFRVPPALGPARGRGQGGGLLSYSRNCRQQVPKGKTHQHPDLVKEATPQWGSL